MSDSVVIYPGSFDPITNGHLDLIERGLRMFGGLVVAVLQNIEKQPFFTTGERVEMLREVTRGYPNVSVETFSGLMVEYAKKKQARAVLRGIRAFSDYEYELQMALMNRKLEPDVETVFLMPTESYTYISSRMVKEVLMYGGSVKNLVPPIVETRMKEKLAERRVANG